MHDTFPVTRRNLTLTTGSQKPRPELNGALLIRIRLCTTAIESGA